MTCLSNLFFTRLVDIEKSLDLNETEKEVRSLLTSTYLLNLQLLSLFKNKDELIKKLNYRKKRIKIYRSELARELSGPCSIETILVLKDEI